MAVDPKSPWKIADAHMIPGKGKLPLKKLLTQLKTDKYNGPISLELWYENYGKDISDEVVIKNFKFAKKFVETNFR